MNTADEFAGPINLGSPAEITIASLAEKIISMTGSKSRITHKTLPGDDPRQRRPDITLARDGLGWEPVTTLDDGLSKTIAYFEDVLRLHAGRNASA